MALPETYNLNIYRGDRYVHPFQLADRDGVAIDLANLTLEAQLWADVGAEAQGFTINVVGAATGDIELSLAGELTAVLPDRSYWALNGTDQDNNTQTYVAGVARAHGPRSE